MVVVEKVITCRIDINDVSDQFCPDYSVMRMEKLKKQFVGYCFRGMLITSIESIIRSSQIRTNPKSLDGGMHLDITARVKGIIYEPGEIIPDVQINNLTNTVVSASSNFAKINIVISGTNILKVDDITPVIVKISQYNIYTNKISIAAEQFLPKISKAITLYLCDNDKQKNSPETGDFKELIRSYLEHFKEMSADKKKSLEYFSTLIYPYKKYRVPNKLQIGDLKPNYAIESKAIVSYVPKSGDVLFKPECYLNDNNIYALSNTNINISEVLSGIDLIGKFGSGANSSNDSVYKINVVRASSADILNRFLTQYIKNLYVLMQLTETYPDKASLAKSSHIWNYYNFNKK